MGNKRLGSLINRGKTSSEESKRVFVPGEVALVDGTKSAIVVKRLEKSNSLVWEVLTPGERRVSYFQGYELSDELKEKVMGIVPDGLWTEWRYKPNGETRAKAPVVIGLRLAGTNFMFPGVYRKFEKK